MEERETFAEGRLEMGLAGGGSFRWVAANLTELVEACRARLDLSPVAAAALGRSMTGAALLLRLASKIPTRLVLEIRGDGPARQVLAEADEAGNVRGLVGHPRVQVPHAPDGKLDVGRAVGEGHLRVLREHDGGSYHSQVELVSGEIGEDIAHYLEQSEQIRSAVLLGVLARPFGVAGAGGMILQVLPAADETALATLETNLERIAGVSRLLEEGGLEEMRAELLAGLEPETTETRSLYYRCRCSRERLLRHLAVLGPEERDDYTLDDGSIEAECLFCASKYVYRPEELEAESA